MESAAEDGEILFWRKLRPNSQDFVVKDQSGSFFKWRLAGTGGWVFWFESGADFDVIWCEVFLHSLAHDSI